jgi:molybdopterin/thiamine biosynthesis adenylyltransferase
MASVLVIGAGGLGCGALLALTGTEHHVHVVDPDHVDRSNLHRQVLYRDEMVGEAKAPLAASRVGGTFEIGRVTPESCASLVQRFDVVLEGTDRAATKLVVADACLAAGVPLAAAGIVRWGGWALSTRAGRTACLRCIFEDNEGAPSASCSEAGVLGPAVGTMGSILAAMTLDLLCGHDLHPDYETFVRYDARSATLRSSRPAPRHQCRCRARAAHASEPPGSTTHT